MTKKLHKIIVGFALKYELYNGRPNRTLSDLYLSPDIDIVKKLYERLIVSNIHFDRVVAFWLELAIQRPPLKVDLHYLIDTLSKMEVILYDLLWRVNPESQNALNNWLNYLANVPHCLQSGLGIDAKILMSQALESSQRETIERIKKDLTLKYKVNVLQAETSRFFKEINNIPLKLAIPAERQDYVVTLQEIIIDLLQYSLQKNSDEINAMIRYPIQRLEDTQNRLMQTNSELKDIKDALEHALGYLKAPLPNSIAYDNEILDIVQRIKNLRNSLE